MVEQELSYEEFRELVLSDPTFGGKLQMFEQPVEPKNLKERAARLADYMQDTFDQFTKDTEAFNSMIESFNRQWDGKMDAEGKTRGGLSSTTKAEFSWMKSMVEELAAHRKKEITRAVQSMALQEAEIKMQYNELARVYGDPKGAIASILKELDAMHGIVGKLSALDEKIQGQLKLGKKVE